MGLYHVLSGSSIEHPANPNPRNFEILLLQESDTHTLAVIKYPNCTNYEGIKVLIYDGKMREALMVLGYIDPHFLEDRLSPIARFHPEKVHFGAMRAFGFINPFEIVTTGDNK